MAPSHRALYAGGGGGLLSRGESDRDRAASAATTRILRALFVVAVFVGSNVLVADLVASALTPSQIRTVTERAHDVADELGFNGIGDWILEAGADGSEAEHEGEGDFLPTDGEEEEGEPPREVEAGRGAEGGAPSFTSSLSSSSEGGDAVDEDATTDAVSPEEDEGDKADVSAIPRAARRSRRKTHPLSVLQRATVADVRMEPFPHLVIKDALPPKLYAQLAGSFPPDTLFRRASNGGRSLQPNVRYDIPAHKVISQNMLATHWREFIAYHTSQEFYEEVAELFGEGILRYRPDLYALAAKMQKIKEEDVDAAAAAARISGDGAGDGTGDVGGGTSGDGDGGVGGVGVGRVLDRKGTAMNKLAAKLSGDSHVVKYYERANITSLRAVRGRGAGVNLRNADIKLECQVGINSPSSRGGTSVRGPHVDRRGELFAGLLYLKHPNDHSRGGDLRTFRCKGECKQLRTPAQKARAGIVTRQGHEQFDPRSLVTAGTVKYASNVFVMFINNPLSVHAVTPRGTSRISRRLINFTGEFNPTSAARSREGLCCNKCAFGRKSQQTRQSRCALPAKTDRIPDNNRFPQ